MPLEDWEVDGGPPIEVGGVDIADAFYNIALPVELRGLFGLPAVSARDVGIEMIEGKKVRSGAKVYIPSSKSCLWDGHKLYGCVRPAMSAS